MSNIAFLKEKNRFSPDITASLVQRLKLSKICLLILTSIQKDPQQWEADSHRFKNEKVGLQMWIANGSSCAHIEGHGISRHTLSDKDMSALWTAYQSWVEAKKEQIFASLELAIGGIDVDVI
jgi:hypothetical protein